MQGFVKRFMRGLKYRPYLSATFSLGFMIYAVLHFYALAMGDLSYKLGGILPFGYIYF